MKRIYRSARDKKLFGVCGGLAEATGIDATIIRIVLVIAAVFSGGAPIPIYIIAAMIMPKDPTYTPHYGAPGWAPPPPPPQSWGTPPTPPTPPQQPPYGQPPSQGYYPPKDAAKSPSIDDLMGDIEKKALQKELNELKAKLAQYEKGQKGDD